MTEAISKLSQDSITAHHLNLWYGTDGKTSAADRGHIKRHQCGDPSP